MSAARILVVDDHPTNLKLVCDLLRSEGHEIFEATETQAAQRIIDEHPLDLVLLDLALPGMDGLTFTRQLRAQPRTRHLAIVALTAFAMVGDEEKARAAGCDGYITKPIDTRALPGQVAAYLPHPGPDRPKSGMKILVIEDTPSELKLARLILTGEGHEVSGVDAAEAAFQAVRENRPQLILLDMMLPGMHGLELARRLKTDPETRDIHIVAITSFPERFPRAAALAAGCDGYIIKPLNTREIAGQLEQVASGGVRSVQSQET
jgi:two-component system cell cycle response regulator